MGTRRSTSAYGVGRRSPRRSTNLCARGVPVGGTSSGLEVMGEYLYSAEADGAVEPHLSSTRALRDPCHPRVTVRGDFLRLPHLHGVLLEPQTSFRRVVTRAWPSSLPGSRPRATVPRRGASGSTGRQRVASRGGREGSTRGDHRVRSSLRPRHALPIDLPARGLVQPGRPAHGPWDRGPGIRPWGRARTLPAGGAGKGSRFACQWIAG